MTNRHERHRRGASPTSRVVASTRPSAKAVATPAPRAAATCVRPTMPMPRTLPAIGCHGRKVGAASPPPGWTSPRRRPARRAGRRSSGTGKQDAGDVAGRTQLAAVDRRGGLERTHLRRRPTRSPGRPGPGHRRAGRPRRPGRVCCASDPNNGVSEGRPCPSRPPSPPATSPSRGHRGRRTDLVLGGRLVGDGLDLHLHAGGSSGPP